MLPAQDLGGGTDKHSSIGFNFRPNIPGSFSGGLPLFQPEHKIQGVRL
jgi:hypothetical protein